MVICLVAGEASGDQLGAALIRAVRENDPAARFVGIGGPLMKAESMDCWWDYSQLAIMGLFEIINHIPRLLGLRRRLIERVVESQTDLYVGIDAPDFNLPIEKRLKGRGVPVIHYVSPTIWAWRPGRVKSIAKSTERVLCLFPFELDYYQKHAVAADYTGHPLADEIPLQVNAVAARTSLGIESDGPCIALLPGSRRREVETLSTPMLEAASMIARQYPGSCFLMPVATELSRQYFEAESLKHPDIDCRIYSNRSKDIMAAANVVICASGTATLEVMLINRPMVVCYRLATATYLLLKWFKLFKSRFFALPNVIASEALVPELLQNEVTPERIAHQVSRWLDQPVLCEDLKQRFEQLHRQLKTNAAATAAAAVLGHIGHPSGSGSISE